MSAPTRQSHPRSLAQNRWEAWQAKPISRRLLPSQARQEGYTVLRVPTALRLVFLDVAQVCRLYDALFQKGRRPLPASVLAHLRTWAEVTQALITALQETPHD